MVLTSQVEIGKVGSSNDGIGSKGTKMPPGGLSPLSNSVWNCNKKKKEAVTEMPARLTWKDLWVEVAVGSKSDNQVLLHSLTGYAEPGAMLAIMGPSGSGKSTLLDSLAGRLAKNARLTGDIKLNGRRKTTLSYGIAAYVTQVDELIGTLTVRETVEYSARLRLPGSMPVAERKAIVKSTIVEMGLQDCQNTYIGNWHLRGLSGGEKRRLSIGLEILTRPRLLFLDEPTSGLDSAAAFFVVTTLKQLARDGRTVIASIHQPSSETFEIFDNLCLLSNGHQIYFGEAASARQLFEQAGFPVPALRSPSDHFLRCVNSDFDTMKMTMSGSKSGQLMKSRDLESAYNVDKLSTPEVVGMLIETFAVSEFAEIVSQKVHEINQKEGPLLEGTGSQASFFTQAYVLTKRSFVNMYRDVGYYWLRLAVYILLTVCIGTMYFNIGNEFGAILGRAGCMSYVGGFLTFMSIGGFPSFVEDMKVFYRERLNGHYGVTAFVVGNSLSSMPYLFLISLVSGSIVYFMVQLHPGFEHFAYFVLILFSSVLCVESLMMAVASVVPNFLMGIITGAGIQGIFMLVAGYFRLPNDLPKPVWRYPMFYISFDMYSLEGLFQNDFLGLTFENFVYNGRPIGPPLTGDFIVYEQYQIERSRTKWQNLAVIFGMVIGYRMIFFLMIKVAEDVRPVVRYLFAKYYARCMGPKSGNRTRVSKTRPVNHSPARG
ncbi:ATP-binding cassette, subfamily G (WHITE), member 2 [Marchantia polymorpha subsp. ruderalis]|uniref:ABC transporter domain-containing protein n=2 Tax=Marchantia polymorpha TaxID=3197 RepID=A0A176VRX5_MARPO|nr:hypothetical protein AXG93_4316s1010 [Marchantia polymorpha subsp. ruderalis]PTQ32506.1 hypothetical protein MARPO_0098s0052 [Marchantia polymorpha]BBN07153.1 hypothetical protein Mp_4g01480 [Marchantia polymorpha subsp. ruderalis]|eukprot:PTQ32506.1 hypothetical protein MARPO_0098s0052 [Marchantia polymorpha]